MLLNAAIVLYVAMYVFIVKSRVFYCEKQDVKTINAHSSIFAYTYVACG